VRRRTVHGRLRLTVPRLGDLPGREDLGQHRVDRNNLPGLDADAQDAVRGRLDLDGRLVGLDLDDQIALSNLGAVRDEPAGDLALLHRDRELLEPELGHAGLPAQARSTASTIASAEG
jgi:hypothetical protein